MNAKTFIWLAALTVGVVIAAGYSVSERYWNSETVRTERLAFIELAEKMNDVAEIRIENSDERFTVRRIKDKWVVVDKNNYPAKFAKIREIIAGVANLVVVDAKTKNPKLYPRIAVMDPKGEEFDSKYLGLKDASGKVVAELLVGNRKFNMGGGEDNEGIYFRRPTEAQAFLARGKLELSRDVLDWLDPTLVDVKVDRVQYVRTRATDGSEIIVSRKDPISKDFTLQNLAEGAKLKDSAKSTLNDLVSGLKEMELRDIAKESEKVFPADKIETLRFKTFKGLTVNLKMVTAGEDTWAEITAEADPKMVDAVKEAAEINKRSEGWVFKLWDYKVKPLRVQMKDLVDTGDQKKSS